MNIVYHASDSFAKVTGTSIVSIFENNKDIDEINVYVIEKNFTEDNKKKMEQLADKYNRRIIFISMPDINRTELLIADFFWTNYCQRKLKKCYILMEMYLILDL